MQGQNTRSYLLDIYATPGTPVGRIRVEAQLKAATWLVAPLEVRVLETRVPRLPNGSGSAAGPNVAAPASAPALMQLQRYPGGLLPQVPGSILRFSDVAQRNAAEDMLVAGQQKSALGVLVWSPIRWRMVGAEWYLRVRDLLNG